MNPVRRTLTGIAVVALLATVCALYVQARLTPPAVHHVASVTATRAFFVPSADIDTSRIDDARHISREVSDMYRQGLGWADSVNLSQFGFSTNGLEVGPAEMLAAQLESQGWYIRWAPEDGALLAFPPA